MGWLATGLCRAMFSRADTRRESSRRDYEAEVLSAGWVPPILDLAPLGLLRKATDTLGDPGLTGGIPVTDVPDGLLARVYVHQDC